MKMKKTITNTTIEYLSIIFILSYFLIHNILLVFAGITLSKYLININFINSIIRSLNNNSLLDKSSNESNLKIKEKK